MEKTLKMGAFQALDSREMMDVNGGALPLVAEILIGWTVCKVADYVWDNRQDIRGYRFLG